MCTDEYAEMMRLPKKCVRRLELWVEHITENLDLCGSLCDEYVRAFHMYKKYRSVELLITGSVACLEERAEL